MLGQGMSQWEVEKALELTEYRPVHQLLKRVQKKEVQGISKTQGQKDASRQNTGKIQVEKQTAQNEK